MDVFNLLTNQLYLVLQQSLLFLICVFDLQSNHVGILPLRMLKCTFNLQDIHSFKCFMGTRVNINDTFYDTLQKRLFSLTKPLYSKDKLFQLTATGYHLWCSANKAFD